MRTILVADDHADTRFMLRVILEGQGWKVLEAADGEQALAKAAAGPPDVLLVDLRMPGLMGDEVLRRVREDGLSMPVLLMTAARIDARLRALGFAATLQKPFEPDALLTAIEQSLSGAP